MVPCATDATRAIDERSESRGRGPTGGAGGKRNRPLLLDELPEIDERLVEPETRYEIMNGVLVYVLPADEPHAERHAQLAALVGAHAAVEYHVACDMLTRTSKVDDIAPDISVYPSARHPVTGRRQIDQLSFEIVSKQSLGYVGERAAKLTGRGVRRVFAIDVKRKRALEWSTSLARWVALDRDAYIEDPVLDVPLPVDALIRTARADDAVARALLVKGNPVLKAARDEARAAGKKRGLTEGKKRGLAEGKKRGLTEGKKRGLTEGKKRGLAEGKKRGLAEGKKRGLTEGKKRGLAEGKKRGLAEGKKRGLAEGVVRGRAQAVIALLAARNLPLSGAERARILRERDAARLGRWLVRAAACERVAAIFRNA